MSSRVRADRAAALPPASVRNRFWLLGRRVEPVWRPWVAEQVTRPGYLLRRQLMAFGLQLVVVIVPQISLSFFDDSRWRLYIFSTIFVVAFAFGVLGSRRKQELQVARLLAYYGVTADGELREPVSAWRLLGYQRSVFTPLVSTLVVAQLVVFITGLAFVIASLTEADRCRTVSTSVVDALEDELGQTMIPGSAISTTPLFEDGRLRFPRRVDSGLDGLYFVAAYVDGAPASLGQEVAVWRVIEAGGAFALPTKQVGSANDQAQRLTPRLGRSFTQPPDPRLLRAVECARQAADRD